MRNNKTLAYTIGGSLAIIAVVAAVVIAYLMSPANVYARHVASAEKYLESGDYSRAILSYRDAIEQDPNNVEAYAGLAEIYINQNDTDSAVDLLRRGVARTDSARLRLMLNVLIKDETADNGEVAVDLKTEEAVYLDTGTLEIIGSYSYADYSSKYGLENKQGNRDGSVTCTFRGLDAELTFSNTDKQPNVVSATTVTANAIPTNIVYRNALNLFGGGDLITYQTLETLHLTKLHMIDHPEWNKAIQFEEKNVRITIQSDENGNIYSGAANTLVPLKSEEAPEEDKKLVLATGMVKDAQTGAGLPNVHLFVRQGTYQTGSTVEEANTTNSGNYEFNVDPGEYTIEITADGYATTFVTIYIGSYETTHVEDLVITKEVSTGEARIVLTWGSSPSDLDSYLTGTLDDGTRVFTGFATPKSGSNAELDIDDRNGNGPETTTLYNLNGTFRFVVMDFTGSGRMNSSGAVVTVYLPNQPAQTISINTGISGNVWCVLEIDHGQLNIVNNGNAGAWGMSESATSLY